MSIVLELAVAEVIKAALEVPHIVVIRRITLFEEDGDLTGKAGLVLHMFDGSIYRVSVERSS